VDNFQLYQGRKKEEGRRKKEEGRRNEPQRHRGTEEEGRFVGWVEARNPTSSLGFLWKKE